MTLAAQRILYCTSEIYPLVKTGGLGDVAASLSCALQQLGHDVHVVLPAYRSLLQQFKTQPTRILRTTVRGYSVELLRTSLPGSRVPVLLVDCPTLYDRPGTPYHDEHGHDWKDNAERFALYNHVAALLADDQLDLDWRADIVHANDWQTGLIPVLLRNTAQRPAMLFTIHNLAYQGFFDRKTFDALHLDAELWHHDVLEFHNGFTFMKGGLVFADRINTVSPSYAQEIQTAQFGQGLEGLLQQRRTHLSGILNGIDTRVWNPATDNHIAHAYHYNELHHRRINKHALQARFNLPITDGAIVLGLVSRLVDQKGIDLVIAAIEQSLSATWQWVVLGNGDKRHETRLQELAKTYPDRVGVQIGYDEAMAHRIEAGADVFVMPSRFEPCGLNQMYSQHYGAVPIVSPVGGLRDTVVDATPTTLANQSATGIVMTEVSTAGLLAALRRAQTLFENNARWQQLQRTGMQQDFSWKHRAEEYLALYTLVLQDRMQ
ncbi:MAG: glycogen synthase GlgA [Gammaproteobacteria bacterium]|nr:glycogen synthase GlgA [Gammaproteobacteria bacterium]